MPRYLSGEHGGDRGGSFAEIFMPTMPVLNLYVTAYCSFRSMRLT